MKKIISSLRENLLEEVIRWRLWIPVALGLGVGVYFSLPYEPSWQACWGGLCFQLLLCLLWRRWRGPWSDFPCSVFFVGALVSVTLGFSIAATRTAYLHTCLLHRPFKFIEVEATICEAEPTPRGWRFILEDLSIRGTKYPLPPIKKICLTWRKRRNGGSPKEEHPWEPGMRIRAQASLFPAKPPIAPGAFDFRRHDFFRGISARGFFLEEPKILDPARVEASQWSISSYLTRLRYSVNRRIERVLPQPYAAIACALITGEKSAIDPQIRQHFADSGTAHILVIAGLHMSLVGGAIFLAMRRLLCLIPRLALGPHVKKIAAVVSWLTILGYLGLSGAGIPSTRAFFMSSLVTLAVLMNRVAISMFSVAIAATVILLTSPEALLSPSFQMSFAAVAALISVYEGGRVFQAIRKTRKFAYISGLLVTSFVASVAITPFSVYTFQQCTLLSLPANVLAVPITGALVLPCAVAAILLMPFGGEALFLKAMGLGIHVLIAIARTVASWPGAHVTLAPSQSGVLGVFVLGALWMMIWREKWRLWGVFPIGIALWIYGTTPFPDLMVDAAATCVGVYDEGGDLLITRKSRARFAQKTWSGFLNLPQNSQDQWPSEGNETWSLERNGKDVVVTGLFYKGAPPGEKVFHIDLSGRFPEAHLPSWKILRDWGGFIYLNPIGGEGFRSVRAFVGDRPWSLKGAVAPPNASPRKKASRDRCKVFQELPRRSLDDDDMSPVRKSLPRALHHHP